MFDGEAKNWQERGMGTLRINENLSHAHEYRIGKSLAALHRRNYSDRVAAFSRPSDWQSARLHQYENVSRDADRKDDRQAIKTVDNKRRRRRPSTLRHPIFARLHRQSQSDARLAHAQGARRSAAAATAAAVVSIVDHESQATAQIARTRRKRGKRRSKRRGRVQKR